MHLPYFGKCVDRAVQDVLVGFLKVKMFGSGTKKWFVKRPKKQQQQQQQRSGRRPCARKKTRWAARILKEHRQKILSELDVNAVLPYLVYDKVFSLGEYKEILGQESNKKRTEIFLDHLSSKGPAAFCSFCSVLEEVCPHLLTCFLLDGENKGKSFDSDTINENETITKAHGGLCVPVLVHYGEQKTVTARRSVVVYLSRVAFHFLLEHKINIKRSKLLCRKPQTKSHQK